jgi:hypothetical protein
MYLSEMPGSCVIEDNREVTFVGMMPYYLHQRQSPAAVLIADTAEYYRKHGNIEYQKGVKDNDKKALKAAVDHYTKGIDAKCSKSELNAALLNNRAAAHLALGVQSRDIHIYMRLGCRVIDDPGNATPDGKLAS